MSPIVGQNGVVLSFAGCAMMRCNAATRGLRPTLEMSAAPACPRLCRLTIPGIVRASSYAAGITYSLSGTLSNSKDSNFSNRRLRRQSRIAGPSSVSSGHRVVTSWTQDVAWEDVAVADVAKEAELLFSVTLDVSARPRIQEGYTKAGQYVQIKIGDSKPAFLAIASPPKAAKEAGVLEFLVKAVEGSTAELLTRVKAGQEVQVSQVMGKGFHVEALSPASSFPTVLLFATGSGISPIRALIESGFEAAQRRDVRLYFGVRDTAFLPYQSRFKAWEESGVEIVTVLSQPPPAWHGETGFVQAAYERGPKLADPSGAGAVLCGHKGMAEDVKAILGAQGVHPERILLNF